MAARAQFAGQEILDEAGASIYGRAQGTYRNNTSNVAFVTMVANDAQKLTFSADNNGSLQKLDVTLSGATTQAQAVNPINAALQGSNLSSLQSILAVEDSAGSIGFTSTKAFNVLSAQRRSRQVQARARSSPRPPAHTPLRYRMRMSPPTHPSAAPRTRRTR